MALKPKNNARAKAPALDVPQSDAQADATLRDHGRISGELARIQADLDAELAAIKAKHEARAKPLQELLKQRFASLQAFAAAHRQRLTQDGKTKTVEMPAGKFGWRARPPSVALKRGVTADTIVEKLIEFGMRRFIRIKQELNKERILEEPEAFADTRIDGIAIVSGIEDFFVEAFGADLAEPKT